MKTKNSILNFITELVPLIILMFLGLYKSKFLITELAPNYVGLYQLFSQLLGYVTIFEFGMTGALLYRFFAPVSKNDKKRISVLFFSGKKVFNIISLIMFSLGILFSFVIPFLIKDNPFSIWYILLTFLMYISTNIIYYLVAAYKTLLEAEQKKHVTNIIIQSSDILKSLIEIIVLLVFKNLVILLLVGIVASIISSILLIKTCKKYNPDLIDTKERDYEMLSDVKNLFVHKIAYLVNNNVDLIIVTRGLGLVSVVIYSTYNYIVNMLKRITSRVYVSMVPSLGNLIAEDKEQAKNVFFEINDLMFFIAIFLTIALFVSVNPFINIWYEGEVFTSYGLALGFSLIFFVNIVIQPLLAFTDAGGCFKETKKCAVLEAVINLTLSLILFKPFGVFGILLSTYIGYTIADNIVRAKIICNNLLNTSVKKYYYDLIFYEIITAVLLVAEFFVFRNININNIFSWLLISCINCIFVLGILLILFKITKKLTFLERIKKMLFKVKSRVIK